VAAAKITKGILNSAGFADIEVAFRESEVNYSVTGQKLQYFDPLLDSIAAFRKPFTPTLGLPIALLKTPQCEGTGGLYLRLSNDDERVAILTAAHVACPSSASLVTAIYITIFRAKPYKAWCIIPQRLMTML
jgi:hypothetical protein